MLEADLPIIVMPTIALMGVLISWLMLDRNWLFDRLAAKAVPTAWVSCCVISFRSSVFVTSMLADRKTASSLDVNSRSRWQSLKFMNPQNSFRRKTGTTNMERTP